MKAFETILGKGGNAGNQHCLLFPQCFLRFPKQNSIFESRLYFRLQILSIWTSLKICHLVKGKGINDCTCLFLDECEAGEEWNPFLGLCELCNLGSEYKPEGSRICQLCPDGSVSLFSGASFCVQAS